MNIGYIYFSRQGRITRQTWWLGAFLLAGVILAVMITLFFTVGLNDPASVFGLFAVVYVVASYPYYCLSVKRLHDSNTKTWLLLGYVLVADVAAIGQVMLLQSFLQAQPTGPASLAMALASRFSTFGTVLSALSTIVSICGLYLFYLLGFQMGTKGDNEYGPDPLAIKAPAPSTA